jgi:hypothetical protein
MGKTFFRILLLPIFFIIGIIMMPLMWVLMKNVTWKQLWKYNLEAFKE